MFIMRMLFVISKESLAKWLYALRMNMSSGILHRSAVHCINTHMAAINMNSYLYFAVRTSGKPSII